MSKSNAMAPQPARWNQKPLVILESPYGSPNPQKVEENVAYARRCLRESVMRGEAPIASHLLFTQPGVLNDLDGQERRMGIDAGLAWFPRADFVAVYLNRGISSGMWGAIAEAERTGRPIRYRIFRSENHLHAEEPTKKEVANAILEYRYPTLPAKLAAAE